MKIKIIDISKHQAHQQTYVNIIDFEKVKETGVNHVYIKASEGQTYFDPAFENHVKAASAAGLKIGLYHFFRHGRAASGQALNLKNAYDLAKKISGLVVLPPMLDLEPVISSKQGKLIDVDGISSLPKGEYASKAKAFADEVVKQLGTIPFAYTYPGFAQQVSLGAALADYPLWIAHYGVKKPITPKGWLKWCIWQYSGSGKLDGVKGAVDLNWGETDLLPECFAL